jgi:O-acetyl-ADP-ribose deacetylase (regulator of RNase III)
MDLSLVLGDIVDQAVDAVVNTANSDLMGGGVDGAILRAGGDAQLAGVADKIGARSVAFPAVSAGIYGWPMASAADIAIATVRSTPTGVDDVRFVLASQSAYDEFARAVRS